MTVTLLILIALMLLLVYGGVAAPAIIFGAMIVAFWVMVFRLLIGFGRWVTTGGQAACGNGWDGSHRGRQRVARHPGIGPAPKACRNSRCGRMNVASARFCSQCGSSLG